MIRVAIVGGKIDSGGKKNLIMEYYRHVNKENIQFDFLCDSDSQSIPYEEIQMLGGRVYEISPYQHILKNMKDMYIIFKQNRYPIVHAYNSTMNIFPMFVAWIARVPVRISESLSMAHKDDSKTILKKLLRPMSRWFANCYMSCGEECGRWQFGDKVFEKGKIDVFKTVINTEFNSYNPEIREITRKKYCWEDNMIIGHIGRFTAQKNSVRLINIFSAIVKKEPSARLCLIGDGELKTAMLDEIKRLDLEDKVDYLGRREDIQQFYNAMDVFVLPSLYEGLPVVGLEAESCGLPMFFSTEVTREANACELGHFVELEKDNEYWADEIISAIKANVDVRRSHSLEVRMAGFDSESEALRLENYYIDKLRKTNDFCDCSCV